MPLKEQLAKVPMKNDMPRRGLLIAVEGGTASNKEKIVEKIKSELSDPVILDFSAIIKQSPICQEYMATFANKVSIYQIKIACIRDHENEIKRHLLEGNMVIALDYLCAPIAAAHLDDCFGVSAMQNNAAYRTLLSQFRGVLLPDITVLVQPRTQTAVDRLIKRGEIDNEDDYMYSNYRELERRLRTATNYLDNVVVFDADPIHMESEMINFLTMASITDAYQPLAFYSC